jgi:hypothetical protein
MTQTTVNSLTMLGRPFRLQADEQETKNQQRADSYDAAAKRASARITL